MPEARKKGAGVWVELRRGRVGVWMEKRRTLLGKRVEVGCDFWDAGALT